MTRRTPRVAKRLRFAGLALACAAAAGPAGAQTILNVERTASDETPGLRTAIEASAKVSDGNDNVTNVQLSGAVGRRWHHHWLRLLGGAEYLSDSGNRIVRSGFAHLRYNRIFGERWRTFHFVQVQSNRSLLLDRRVLVGSGVRATVVGHGRHRLHLGTGLMLEDERLDRSALPPGEDATSRVVRLANLASWRFEVRDGVELRNVTYWQPRTGDPGDYRVLDDLGLGVGITKRVGLDVRVELRYDSRPPPTVVRRDVTFATSIKVAFP